MNDQSGAILVCDDEELRAEHWRDAIERHVGGCSVDVLTLSLDQFRGEVATLERRRKDARAAPGESAYHHDSLLDGALALVVDYDLLEWDDKLTGEVLAYLTRCYSLCGAIIALNRFGESVFDLSLRGHPESFADLNIGGVQLDNPGLWREPFGCFRPWAWPLLLGSWSVLEQRSAECLGALDSSIIETIGMTEAQIQAISRDAKAFLGGERDPRSVTWREFVTESGQGLRPRDRPLNDTAVARIAASRIGVWLDRLVLPGQHVFVDAPHLAARLPGLFEASADWNSLATLGCPEAMQEGAVGEYRFPSPLWTSRPVWDWQGISLDADVMKHAGAPDGFPDLVFCEDISQFFPRDATREFVADVAGPFVRRFVVDWEAPGAAATYATCSGQSVARGADVSRVEYRPAVRFAL